MPKLFVAGLLVAVGLTAVISQIFRDTPNGAVFFGGIILAVFGAIGFSDGKADA